MKGKTHVAIGVASASLLVASTLLPQVNSNAPFYASVVIGALAPDIDHAGSTIGSKIPILPHLLKHRGVTHSLLMMGILYYIGINVGIQISWLYGFLIGYGSHLLADSITPAGISLFYPLSLKVRVPLVSSGLVEWLIMVGCVLVVLGVRI